MGTSSNEAVLGLADPCTTDLRGECVTDVSVLLHRERCGEADGEARPWVRLRLASVRLPGRQSPAELLMEPCTSCDGLAMLVGAGSAAATSST